MSTGGVEQLRGAVDRLAELDLDELSDAELHDTVIALQREQARLGSVAAGLLARWDRRGVWAGDRSRSAASRLARELRCSLTSANVELRRARKLATMPHTAAAVLAGSLSLDHVDVLGRANQPWRDAVFTDHEKALVGECAKLRFSHAVKAVDYWCQRADAMAAEDEAERCRVERAQLFASTTLDSVVVLTGVLDPIGGAIVTRELKRLERDLYLADERDGVVRTASQRRAAALVEMATRSRRPGQRAAATATVQRAARRRHLQQHVRTRQRDVISPGELVPHLGDAELETILFDGPFTVVAASIARKFCGRCGERSRSATGTANTHRTVTWPRRTAMSTTSTP